jgi:hypothetical protein
MLACPEDLIAVNALAVIPADAATCQHFRLGTR